MEARTLDKLRHFNAGVRSRNPSFASAVTSLSSPAGTLAELPSDIASEVTALRRFRPIFPVRYNDIDHDHVDADPSAVWSAGLKKARARLAQTLGAVGRIDLRGAELAWAGTAWLIAENIIVTSGRVARMFADSSGDGFTFRMGAVGPIAAEIDFLHEINNPQRLVFRLIRPLYLAEEAAPDVAFFEIEIIAGLLMSPEPIALANDVPPTGEVGIVGYAAYDSRLSDIDVLEAAYGKVSNAKTFALGKVIRISEVEFTHDCALFGDFSGAAVIDLDSGAALGLNVGGGFLSTGTAIRSPVIGKLLSNLRAGRSTRRASRLFPSTMAPGGKALLEGGERAPSATITVPLTVTISIGSVVGTLAPVQPANVSPSISASEKPVVRSDWDDPLPREEPNPKEYRERTGFDPCFLGEEKLMVNLPLVRRNPEDVLRFEFDGDIREELKYEHFSVFMSRSRRMAFFSAANIDGNLLVKPAEFSWTWDTRIPRSQQIMDECYGAPPKFDRGVLARREGASWGDVESASRGSGDTAHITNVVPQTRAVCSSLWSRLEEHALRYTRDEERRLTVITGPYFDIEDLEVSDIKIPRALWKIIAFKHHETERLCATGYEVEQSGELEGSVTQIAISSIAERSGIEFGIIENFDPLGRGERRRLVTIGDVRFDPVGNFVFREVVSCSVDSYVSMYFDEAMPMGEGMLFIARVERQEMPVLFNFVGLVVQKFQELDGRWNIVVFHVEPSARSAVMRMGILRDVQALERQARLPVLVSLRDATWDRNVEGLEKGAQLGSILTAMASRKAIDELVADPAVASIEASRIGGIAESSRSMPWIKAPVVQYGSLSEKGAGTLVAIIDDGIDVLHEAFRIGNKSRILAVWDQTDNTGLAPVAVNPEVYSQNYGTLHVRSDISRYIAAGAVGKGLGRDEDGHGTHVASIAAGSPVPAANFPGGVAPEADLLFVIPWLRTTPGQPYSIGYSKAHVDALKFVRSTAEDARMPVVVNVSQGMNAGAHDGTSLLERGFDEFSNGGAEPGYVVVKSAGNEFGHDGHCCVQAFGGGVAIIKWSTTDMPRLEDYLEFWFPSDCDLAFQLIAPNGDRCSVDHLSRNAREPLNGITLDMTYTINHPDNGDSCVVIVVRAAGAALMLAGDWVLEIMGNEVHSTCMVHGWVERDNARAVRFRTGSANELTLSIPGTARSVITVGACETRSPLVLSSDSSHGPTRDDRKKPELVAPGVDIVAARAGTSVGQVQMSGTSMAAPHVTGAVALALARRKRIRRPQLNAVQIRKALSRRLQNYSGNFQSGFGYGALDVEAFLNHCSDLQ